MRSAVEKWQATVVVLAIVAASVAISLLTDVDPAIVVGGLFGIANLLLGAGAVAHGVSQTSQAVRSQTEATTAATVATASVEPAVKKTP